MSNVIEHPRKPPSAPEAEAPLSEELIRQRARAMRTFFDGLISEYPRSAQGGRLDAWRKSAHAYIDLVTDAPFPEATNGQE